MQSDDNHWLPAAKHYNAVRDGLEAIEKRLQADKEVSKEKKENYVRVIGEMRYNVGKVIDRWPAEIDKIMDNLASILR